MARAEMGDSVRIYYKAFLDNGTIVEGTVEGDLYEFTVGDPDVREMFTRMVDGMEEGEKRTVVLKPEDAYGPYNPDFVIDIPRSKFPPDAPIQIGTRMEVQADPGGAPIEVAVKAVTDHLVTLDANHPLAGETVTLTVQLMEISV